MTKTTKQAKKKTRPKKSTVITVDQTGCDCCGRPGDPVTDENDELVGHICKECAQEVHEGMEAVLTYGEDYGFCEVCQDEYGARYRQPKGEFDFVICDDCRSRVLPAIRNLRNSSRPRRRA